MVEDIRVNIETWAYNEVQSLRAEVARLNDKLNFTYCAYCGKEEPIDGAAEKITEHILSCDKHPIRLLVAENGRLRERAERAERERDALIEACLTRYSSGCWSAFFGNYALGTFDSRDAAIREVFGCIGLDAAPAGEEPPP